MLGRSRMNTANPQTCSPSHNDKSLLRAASYSVWSPDPARWPVLPRHEPRWNCIYGDRVGRESRRVTAWLRNGNPPAARLLPHVNGLPGQRHQELVRRVRRPSRATSRIIARPFMFFVEAARPSMITFPGVSAERARVFPPVAGAKSVFSGACRSEFATNAPPRRRRPSARARRTVPP